MKFDTPAGASPLDQQKLLGRATDRIDGPLKATGAAKYAYEWHDEVPNAAYGYVIGAAIAKGRIVSIDTHGAKSAPGVIGVLTASDVGPLRRSSSTRPNYWVDPRSSTITRPLPSWSPRPSSRRAPPRNACR